MSTANKASYGTWKSPLAASDIASGTVRLGQVFVQGGCVYWLEGRPSEGGRYTIMRRSEKGEPEELLNAPFNARSLVHEYGGAAYIVSGEDIFFTNFDDQCIYHMRAGRKPVRVTRKGPWRYADFALDSVRKRLLCVLEDRSDTSREPQNMIASVAIGSLGRGEVEPVVVASGNDFVGCPRLSPGGKLISWISWDHPNLPWDGCNLHVGLLSDEGGVLESSIVAGGISESIFQPEWSPDGALHFVSDRSGWWNIYRLRAHESELLDGLGRSLSQECLVPGEYEYGMPMWIFGMTTYTFLTDGRILAARNDKGMWKLGLIGEGEFEPIDAPYSDYAHVVGDGGKAAMLAGSPHTPLSVVSLDPQSGTFCTIKASSSIGLEPGYVSSPEVIEFPTSQGKTAFAFYYPPTNKDFIADESERPPLLVKSHGGPTGATSTTLNLVIQYYTSRGFAVVDVNYGGSTGYGRDYMRRLEHKWGVVDVDDCENAALYLVEKGKADRDRLAITGGSAGGYTTLAALTFKDTFNAGASHYGIGDLKALIEETHKFESRYDDFLIGPQGTCDQLIHDRSPVNFTEQLSCPLIVFQGLEDKVVPPSQAESMVEAVRNKKLPVAYLAYEGEQHGFRKAENIKRTIEAEFYFFARVFGFEPADEIEPVEIDNLAVGV